MRSTLDPTLTLNPLPLLPVHEYPARTSSGFYLPTRSTMWFSCVWEMTTTVASAGTATGMRWLRMARIPRVGDLILNRLSLYISHPTALKEERLALA
jgi:hypothetical protein